MENEIPFKELYQQGDRLILKLYSDDIFEGHVADVGENRIELVNVKQHNNKNILSTIYTFYRNEIQTIQQLQERITEKQSASTSSEKVEDSSKIKLTDLEYDRLKDMSRDYTYIDQTDARYFQAVELLSRAETIGVAPLGVEKSRDGSIKLLGVSMWDKVYLFDFVNQRSNFQYKELQDILETEFTVKVIHEAGPLIDILYRKHKIFVKNVFDPQVVDLIIKKKETGSIPSNMSDISDLLTDYFNFPSSYLQNALETKDSKWTQRPLSDRRKGYAAQLVTYLIALRQHMERKIFSEMYEAIDNVHNYYYSLDSFQFASNWKSRNTPKEIEDVIPNLGKS
ncbi:piRNA biogenesis protein EXD1-like [Diabrotica virgifera virgifera]|uniref:PiRNA biogenesis protein EXD1-like n=1 Tax=Diabrotica virgifera virgifera TaxID=50390 RepID=A0A6P7G5S7_DIAVI|nr:piRNA biogenesis protein EXD1-like [Diabrotica virgifera virgifera]